MIKDLEKISGVVQQHQAPGLVVSVTDSVWDF